MAELNTWYKDDEQSGLFVFQTDIRSKADNDKRITLERYEEDEAAEISTAYLNAEDWEDVTKKAPRLDIKSKAAVIGYIFNLMRG